MFRIQEVNKIIESRHEEVLYMKDRLKTVYGEDWDIIPKDDIKIEDDIDVKPDTNNIPTVKIKEEITEEGNKVKNFEY